ncbi:MAG: ywqD 1 [Gemmataceae bacterium]|nr:ywqD 1 [Gemmataceae bacterium]
MPVPPAGPYGPNPGYHATTPSAAKAGPTPAGLLNALKRRWVLATFLGALVAVAAAATVWMVLPAGKHQARAVVQLRANTPEVGHRSADEFENFRRDQMFLLKSRDLHNRTLSEPSVASLDTVKNADDAVRMLDEGIKVSDPSPQTILISLTGDNPEDLKTLLNMLVKKYIDDSTAEERRKRDDRTRRLELLLERFRLDIQAKERSIRMMAEANRTLGGDAAAAKLARMQQELAKHDSEVFASQKEAEELRVNVELLKKKLDKKRFDLDPLELNALVNGDFRVGEFVRQKAAKEYVLQRELERAADTMAPTVLALKSEIEQLEKSIAKARVLVEPEILAVMAKMNEQQLKSRLADLQDKLSATDSLLANRQRTRDDFEKTLAKAASGGFDIDTLLKELDPQRTILNQLESQRVNLMVDKELDARVSIREPASVMLNQNQRQKTLLAIGAGVAAFLLVLVVIGYLEWRTRRIDSVDQVVTDLGMRVIGTVPSFPNKASLKAAEAAGNANWRFILNESINSTRTMLLHTARKESMQVVMVTSATQGEGKTSLASQLGTSMATAGMRTLIVDCDLRNPSIHKLFDLGLQVGVSEVLCQEADVSDAVQPTAVPNLWVIPAGQCSTRVITALAQGHPLETLFNRLRGQFDFIIVDSCPVLPVADALLIGQHVDGVVFSIMQDISQLPKVLVASEKLQQLNVPLLGAVVNGVSGGSAYYAYGYNYVKQLPA